MVEETEEEEGGATEEYCGSKTLKRLGDILREGAIRRQPGKAQ